MPIAATKTAHRSAKSAFGCRRAPLLRHADPHALGIRCFVNDELRHLVTLWDQMAELSQAMTLEPAT